MVAEADAVGEVFAYGALRGGRAAQKGEGEAVALFDGTAVDDVEDGGHAVAVGGIEAAGGEEQVVDEVRVDDAEPFLLSAADELGTVDFHPVDVDQVLVERAAADGVLRRELVVGADVGQGFDVGFNALVGAYAVFYALDVNLGEGGGAYAVVADGDGVELGGGGFEGEVKASLFAFGQPQAQGLRFVSGA